MQMKPNMMAERDVGQTNQIGVTMRLVEKLFTKIELVREK